MLPDYYIQALRRAHVAVIKGQIALCDAKSALVSSSLGNKKAGPDVYRLPGNSGGIPEGVKLPA